MSTAALWAYALTKAGKFAPPLPRPAYVAFDQHWNEWRVLQPEGVQGPICISAHATREDAAAAAASFNAARDL